MSRAKRDAALPGLPLPASRVEHYADQARLALYPEMVSVLRALLDYIETGKYTPGDVARARAVLNKLPKE